MLLDIGRFRVDNTLIYLSRRNFFFNTTNNLRPNPYRETINCNENIFQMFYFFIQQIFIWAYCKGSKQEIFQSTTLPRFWCKRTPMQTNVIVSLFTINGGFYGIVLSHN